MCILKPLPSCVCASCVTAKNVLLLACVAKRKYCFELNEQKQNKTRSILINPLNNKLCRQSSSRYIITTTSRLLDISTDKSNS